MARKKQMETKEIDSSGVVVQLRTSEAFLRKENSSPTAQDSITALFEKNGVSVREIKSDGPYWAFERAIRETQKSLNQKVNKEWQKNKSYMDTRTQYMFNKVSSERAGGTYELIIKDTNYSKEETELYSIDNQVKNIILSLENNKDEKK